MFQPKRILGMGLCARPTFFFFSVFVDFLNCVFWHLWYIIRKLLKSSFICTEASFSGLFVWKIWGVKVFQNSPIKDRTCSTSRRKFRQIQDHIENISKLINKEYLIPFVVQYFFRKLLKITFFEITSKIGLINQKKILLQKFFLLHSFFAAGFG